jgi:hypothetical protein
MALTSPTDNGSDDRTERTADLVLLKPVDDLPSACQVTGVRAIRVVIADGQPVVRAGLRALLAGETELWDTWIVGTPIAGQNIDSVLTVGVIDDLDHNGIYDDASDVVADVNHDGRIDAADLDAIGVASNVVTIPLRINGDSVAADSTSPVTLGGARGPP